MTKPEHIVHWMTAAALNWEEANKMFAAATYVPCLFWVHLSFEKLAKAFWILDNDGNTPPFTHNIIKLLSETTLVLSPTQSKFLQQLNTFQLEGRYESYTMQLRQEATKVFTQQVLHAAHDLRQCILKQLP